MWELTRRSHTKIEDVESLLKDGWEPFSVSVESTVGYLWFRREVDDAQSKNQEASERQLYYP